MQTVHTDVLVIGAGPAGLYQAFQLGLLGLRVEMVDALPFAGGQCAALYADKPIYDIPGIVEISGRALTDQLLQQSSPFLPHIHLGQHVTSFELPDDGTAGTFTVQSEQGTRWHAHAVVIAAGVGAFQPRHWPIPGCEQAHQATNVHYHWPTVPGHSWAGQQVLVVGGEEEAVSTVVDLAALPPEQAPSRITWVHRRAQFTAPSELDAQARQLFAEGKVHFMAGMPQSGTMLPNGTHGHTLHRVDLITPEGNTVALNPDQVLVRQGLSPKLGPISQWGLAMERKQISVNPATCETSQPGIYAVGDICNYPGKLRLITCGFHEATMAAHACKARTQPDDCMPLQYTTTSTILKARLGRG